MTIKPRETASKHRKLLAMLVVLFFFLTASGSQVPVWAEALLSSKFQDAGAHDFVSYFGFKLKNKQECSVTAPGCTMYEYYSESFTARLLLSVRAARIFAMKLTIPRVLIDDEKVTTRGRDIVKSFVLASAIGDDNASLKKIADEIYVRGLVLTPIQPPDAGVRSHNNVPMLQAYKVGKGPVSNGDNAIFLPQLPRLNQTPSPLFIVFSGKQDSIGYAGRHCKLIFTNDNFGNKKNLIPTFSCESQTSALPLAAPK